MSPHTAHCDPDVLDIEPLSEGPTLVDHLDQLLLHRHWQARELEARNSALVADIDDLEDTVTELSAKLRWRQRIDLALAAVVVAVLTACAVMQ